MPRWGKRYGVGQERRNDRREQDAESGISFRGDCLFGADKSTALSGRPNRLLQTDVRIMMADNCAMVLRGNPAK